MAVSHSYGQGGQGCFRSGEKGPLQLFGLMAELLGNTHAVPSACLRPHSAVFSDYVTTILARHAWLPRSLLLYQAAPRKDNPKYTAGEQQVSLVGRG